MSSLIEQAARRLEQLRQAGIAVPETENHFAGLGSKPALAPSTAQTEAKIQATGVHTAVEPATSGPVSPSSEQSPTQLPTPLDAETVFVSRKVDLDLETISAAGIVVPSAPRSRMADQFRVIKRPRLHPPTSPCGQALRQYSSPS